VAAAQGYIRAGKNWVVALDITKFFDRMNHDILMQRIGELIRDKGVLRLIRTYGGVGGCRGAISGTRPDQKRRDAAWGRAAHRRGRC
jgi:RNA-directed DNA polymerase